MDHRHSAGERSFDERDRQTELHALGLSGRPNADEHIDELTRLAADLFAAPVALVTSIDEDRQWYLGSCGVHDATGSTRHTAFCDHALHYDEIMVVPDTWEDARFFDHPQVVGEPYFRFYAGAVLRGPAGNPLGTLCLIDYVPRELSAEEQRGLMRIARVVEAYMHRAGGFATTAQQERVQFADPETGVYHRDALGNRLAHMLEGQPVPTVTVLCVRLGNTAELRAGAGQETARAFLEAVARRLTDGLPAQVEIAHWDDGEFVLAAPAAVPGCDTDELASRVHDLLVEPIELGDMRIRPQVRIGVGQAPEDGDHSDVVVGLARSTERENRWWRNKNVASGKRVFGREAIQRRLRLVQRLERALSADVIEAHLQPRIDLASGLIVGAEALARWDDAVLGSVSPGEFIPLAERIGVLDVLGQNLLRQVARLLARWQGTPAASLCISVNASAEEFIDATFPGRVIDLLAAEGVPCSSLELELTESTLVADFDMVRANMTRLAEAGVRFAVDDFGTGYSSFQYLRQLPVHQLKIDRSFVRDIATDRNDASIVEAVIALAHSLGLEAVAEGVEEDGQRRFLRELGCEQAQGFLYSRAQPPGEFAADFRADRYARDLAG